MAQKPRPMVAALRNVDAICDRYEAAYRGGQMPRIEEFAALHAEAHREQLLVALIALDAELRGITVDARLLGEYRRRFPGDAVAIARAFPDAAFADQPASQPSPGTPAARNESAKNGPPPHSEGSASITLEVTDGPHRGTRFECNQHETLVAGRAEAVQLRLQDDLHFSRHHFRLEANPPVCYLLDMGSRNGTSVNGRKVKECFLKDGDVISGGRTKIRFSVAATIAATIDENTPAPAWADAALPVQAHAPVPAAAKVVERPPAEPVAAAPPARPQIPGYELLEELGRGAMGVVYRASRKATGQDCAVKVLTPAQVSGEKSLQLFLREVSILSQLNHRRIVRFLELGSAGRAAFFVMDYIPGVPFEELVAGRSLMTRVQVVCGIACQVLEALEYAHGLGLVHRDIKPANILLARQGTKLSVKLADFGLAKSFTNAGLSEVSRDGDICGSLAYMAPEQLINSRQAQPACDLYSLGATMYRYLAGENMFDFEEGPCKFLVVLEKPPTPLLERRPELPKELAGIVHQSLEKDPKDRHASARGMREAIEKLMQKLRPR